MRNFKRALSIALVLIMAVACFAGCKSSKADYVIYSDNAFAPFEFLGDNDKYVGIDMDILAAVAEDQGFTYEMHNVGFDAAMGAVQSGQADAMIAGMTITDERKETFDFSDGYFKDGQIMVVPADSAIAEEFDLRHQKVAAKTSTMSAQYTESLSTEVGFEIDYYESSPEMYQAVITGTNVACFEDYSVISYAIKSDNMSLKTVGEIVNPSEYGFAVKKGTNAELIEKFNAGLKNIKANGKYDEILAKYGMTA